jgi:putative transcriptional regulator
MKSAFDKIAAGLGDAIAFAEGDKARGREVKAVDVKAIRATLKQTQPEFARTFRLPLRTVQDWEQHRREPDTGSRLYLAMIDADPEGVQKIIAKVE